MSDVAKLFQNGGSQAVRLPAEFRFEATQVYIWRDDTTGDVILSARPPRRWKDFMALRDRERAVPGDFLADREQTTELRDPLAARK
jgi:antitoxin VapB